VTSESHWADIRSDHFVRVHYDAESELRPPVVRLQRWAGPASQRQLFRPWVMQLTEDETSQSRSRAELREATRRLAHTTSEPSEELCLWMP
ncbi:hypothetical protein MTO96_042477, partial [Rhipicephalus appendiculatus]